MMKHDILYKGRAMFKKITSNSKIQPKYFKNAIITEVKGYKIEILIV